MRSQLLPALRMIIVMTVLTGLAYPLAITAVAQGLFSDRAAGSVLRRDGEIVGSSLQGQRFDSDHYFHARPSAAGDGYDARATGGSNHGPSNQELLDVVARRVAAYRRTNHLAGDATVPVDAVTASGSGLDPHISPANAALQAARVAAARSLDVQRVRVLVIRHTTPPTLGILGAGTVNVVELNLALDAQT